MGGRMISHVSGAVHTFDPIAVDRVGTWHQLTCVGETGITQLG